MKKSSLWKRGTALALSLVLVLGMLPLSAGAGSVSPGSYLSSSAYYGNKSKCKMDAAMANGYAQVLKSMSGSKYKAKLVDISGDGMPLLATVTANGEYDVGNFRIWTWNGTSAKAYNFVKDAEMDYVFGYTFGTLNGTPVIQVGDGLSLDVGGASGHIYYKVKDAQLSIVKRTMSYSAYIMDGKAYGNKLPLVKTKIDSWGQTYASPSALRQAGWTDDGYGGLHLEKENGNYRFFSSVDEWQNYSERIWSELKWSDKQIYEESTGGGWLVGSWSTASSLRSSLLAYVEATGDFVDVSQSHYAYDPVVWAVKEGITNGTSATTFSPDKTCTQGQILTFLWRAVGEPKATIANPFTNSAVTSGQYYYNAMLWAYEQGIVTSKSLNPNAGCQRSDVALYLWRLAGSPAAVGATFSDVSSSAPYAQAVAWAVQEGITNGTSATTFSPSATCTRGQIVTFLYRDMA